MSTDWPMCMREPEPESEAEAARRRCLPALPLDTLVRERGSSFERVRAAGEWSDIDFRQTVGPVLLAFAQHVHLLPQTASDSPGSSLDHGLRDCADALLMTGPGAAPVGQRQYAIVVRSLARPLGAALQRWQLCGASRSSFDPFVRSLAEHVVLDAARSYEVRLRPMVMPERDGECEEAARCLGATLLLRAAPGSMLGRIARVDPALLGRAFHAMPGGPGPASSSAQPVCRTAPPGIDAIVSAMERLIADRRWLLNQKRARLWHLDGHLHLVWKTAANELAAVLDSQAVTVAAAGIDAATGAATGATDLLQVLIAHDVVDPQVGTDGGPLLTLRTPFTEALPVVRLRDTDRWLCQVRAAR